VFWFGNGQEKKGHTLRAACNLSSQETLSREFAPCLEYIIHAYEKNTPRTARLKQEQCHQVKALICCIPFELDGIPRGVLYHDNSYLNDYFNYFDVKQLHQMANHLSRYIKRAWLHGKKVQSQNDSTLENLSINGVPERAEIISQSPIMTTTLSQADYFATSDASILIVKHRLEWEGRFSERFGSWSSL
jgi:transcriptional regulator with GAF, ATPase, and Fis domain